MGDDRRLIAIAVLTMLAMSLGAQTGQSALSLVTLNDLSWRGMARLPDGGGTTEGDPGSPEYTSASLGIRYVENERRLLIANFRGVVGSGRHFSDLVEYRLPSMLATAGDPMAAPTLVETRRWAADWTVIDNTPSWQDPATGVRLGAQYWDEAQGVVWYTAFAYYSGQNKPFLGATRLLDATDTARGGTYRQLGQKFGPWWYRDNDPNDQTNLYWKTASQWIVPVPNSAQSDLKGRRHLIGANPGSVAGQGHIGPGFHAIQLPALTTRANAVLPLGLRLADYSPDSPRRPQHARRDANYTFVSYPQHTSGDTGLWPEGYWQMTLDQVNGCAWVETSTKEGLLCFGRAVSGRTAYGFNPLSGSPGWRPGAPNSFVDPSRPNPENGNGYLGEKFAGAVYRFDPKQLREVARGKRSPWNDGINPVNIGNWKAQWPAMPASGERQTDTFVGSSLVWDDKAQELIWCNPLTAEVRPTWHVFQLK